MVNCRKSSLFAFSALLLVALSPQLVFSGPPTPQTLTVADNANSGQSTSGSLSVGTPASDVGVPASDVGVPASNVGTPASDVGTPATQALPPSYTDDQMIYHVSGKNKNVDTDIVITSPKAGDKWIANTTNTVTWTGTKPQRFSFQLINDDTSILASGISLRASVSTSDGSATCDVPQLKANDGYYIRLYDQLDISKFIAQSEKFSVVDKSSVTNGATPSGGTSAANLPSTATTASNTTADVISSVVNGLTGTTSNISSLAGVKNDASHHGCSSLLLPIVFSLLASISVGLIIV